MIRASKLLTSLENFNNVYNSTKVYSNLEQSNSNHDKLADKSGNPKKPAKAKRHLDIKDTNKHFNKDTNLYLTASNLTLPAKALALVDTPNDNFNTLYTPCIANKQT